MSSVDPMLEKVRAAFEKGADYVIPADSLNNFPRIEKRIEKIPETNGQIAMDMVLNYLYMQTGRVSLTTRIYRFAEPWLTDAERILIKYLKSRTNGVGRKAYGVEALRYMQEKKFRCEICDEGDVRCLNLDHRKSRHEKSFYLFCANCHHIKSRLFDWSGTKKA